MNLPNKVFADAKCDWGNFDWGYFFEWVQTVEGKHWVLQARLNELWKKLPWWERAWGTVYQWIGKIYD